MAAFSQRCLVKAAQQVSPKVNRLSPEMGSDCKELC